MLVILLYWCYLSLITSVYGISTARLLKTKNLNPLLTLILGSFSISLIGGIWAIFGGLSTFFEITLSAIALLLLILQWKNYKTFLFSLKAKIISTSPLLNSMLGIIALFALAQCASAPYILDNESYYIQTIKWLDTYGYAPGLANLHYFLGQTSGWHILQSTTNLEFLNLGINDINGFFLIIGNCYALDKLDVFFKEKKKHLLIAGMFPIFNLFLFQFISAPSPDLAIYVTTLIIFTEFLGYYTNEEDTSIRVLFLLVVFAVYIKVLAIFLMIFPVLLYSKHRNAIKKDILPLGILSLLTLAIFMIKNGIISGYPLYPLSSFKLSQVDWLLPEAMQRYLTDATKFYAFFMTPEEYEQTTLITRFIHWLQLPGLHGLFNKVICILLLLFPFIIHKSKFAKPLRVLYMVSILQLLFLWVTSPQYRFFFGFLMLLSLTVMARYISNTKFLKGILILSITVVAVLLFVPFSLSTLTKNDVQQNSSTFSTAYLILPHPQTKYTEATYKLLKEGNLNYYTPTNIDFFWATGDCALPCIQQQQLQDFKNYFRAVPQLRTDNLKDGFYSYQFLEDE